MLERGLLEDLVHGRLGLPELRRHPTVAPEPTGAGREQAAVGERGAVHSLDDVQEGDAPGSACQREPSPCPSRGAQESAAHEMLEDLGEVGAGEPCRLRDVRKGGRVTILLEGQMSQTVDRIGCRTADSHAGHCGREGAERPSLLGSRTSLGS